MSMRSCTIFGNKGIENIIRVSKPEFAICQLFPKRIRSTLCFSQSNNEFSTLGGLVVVTFKMESFEEWQENIDELSKESENSEASVAETFNRINGESARSVVNALNVQDPSFLVNLIEEVRKYPCIWNVSSKSHKDKPRKMEAWRRISGALCVPGKLF